MDENNLDPEQIRQLNEAFAELKEVVSSTTDNLKSNALKTGMDKIKSSSEQIKNELDKFSRLLKNLNKNLESQPKPESQGEGKDTSSQTNTSAFENIVKVLSGNFSGLNNATLNLIKSFGNLDELVKDKTGSKVKISERLRERTQSIATKNIDGESAVKPENITVNIPEIPAPAPQAQPEIVAPVQPTKPAGPDYDLLSESKITIERLQEFASQISESDKALLRNTGYIRAGENTWKKYSSLMEVAIKKQELLINPVDKQLEQLESVVRGYGYIKDENDKWITTTRELTAEQKLELEERTKVLEGLAKEGRLRKEKDDRDQARKKAEEDLIKNFKELAKVAGTDLAKNFFDSSKGMGKYGETLDKFGGGIIDATKNLGPLGRVAGLAAGGLFKLVGASLKQNEVLNKAYERLSEFGAVDFTGIQGMFDSLQRAGMTVTEIGKFGDILQSVGPNLSTLGMTAAQGAQRISDTFAAIKNTGVEKSLRMLGYNSETLFKTFADYQGLMGRLGFAQGKSIGQLARESSAYAKTLDELAKLTGQSRDEMQKRMDADANDIKFRLRLQEVDEKTRERFQKASVLMGEFSEDTAAGFREMIANSGNVVGEASVKLVLSTGNKARDIILALEKGEISAVEANRRIAMAKAEEVERYRQLGKIDAEIMRELGLTVKDMDAINKYRGKTQQEIEKLDEENKMQMKGQLDSQRAAEVVRSMTERNFEQSKDRLIQLVGVQVAGAFEKLLTIVNSLGKGLANFVKFITFGKVDFTDLFESVDDITNKLKDNGKELSDTTKKISEIKSAQDRYTLAEAKSLAKDQEVRDLELQLRKETNKEAIAELEKKLSIAQKEARVLGDEKTQARLDFNKRSTELPKLEEKKSQLEKTKTSLERKQQEMGGAQPTDTDSPAIKKLKEEAETLAKKRETLKDIISDKFETIRDDVIKNSSELSKLSKEELEKEENIKKINEAIANEKQRYITEQKDIEKRLVEIGKERERLLREEVSTAKKQVEARPPGSAPVAPAQATDMQPNNKEFYDKIYKTLYEEASKAKVENPEAIARLGAAQASLETGYGKSTAGGNNYFGIKGRKGDPNVSQVDTQEWDPKQGKMITVKAGFRKYESMEESAADYIKFLQENKRYKGVLAAKTAQSAINEQGLTGYATDPNYAAKLQSIHLSATATEPTATASAQPPKTAEVQQGKYGGMFSGPDSGYPVLLHGREIVIPMPDTTNIGAQLAQVTKTALDSATPSPVTPSINLDPFRDIAMNQESMIETLISKLDEMIGKLSTSNDIQDKILTYQQT